MFSAQSWEEWKPILFEHGASATLAVVHIIVIVVVGLICVRALRRVISKLEVILTRHHDTDDFQARQATERRVRTLTGLLRTVSTIGVWAMVIVSVLNEMGINIGPILAGVGIAGLAVGFGAQNLVRDVISGFFMILENQVRLGDVAVVNGTSGLVESISFRTIVLRDAEGTVHVYPHGSVTTLANRTMYWSAYVLDVPVAYGEDIDHATNVMKQVAEELSADPEFSGKIIAPIEIFGVDSFGPSEVLIKARLKTLPAEQWKVGREYRRRLKYAFDREQIEIPFPQRRVHVTSDGGLPAAIAEAAGA